METTDNKTRIRDLALRVAQDLEAESSFNWEDAAEDWLTGNYELKELVPSSIAEYLSPEEFDEDPEQALDKAYYEWRDEATEQVLDISGSISFDYGGGLTLTSLTVVLGTGGPHIEVKFDDSGDGVVRAYDWFGSDLTEIPVSFSGHPIAELFDWYSSVAERRV